MFKEKIKTQEELKNISLKLKSQGKKIVFTNGCFDLIHIGHVRYLMEAKKFGDVLIVGLNSDESVRSIKGNLRPVNPQKERAEMLAAMEMVDFIAVFDEDTPAELISIIKPDTHVKGGDYSPDQIPERKVLESYGGKLEIVNMVEGYSTTRLIEKIKNLP